jgi:hypothetical protein
MDPANRPTKVDRRGDVTGLVNIGDVANILPLPDTVTTMESMVRISNSKMDKVGTQLPGADDVDTERRFKCSYVKTADTIEEFGGVGLDPVDDAAITGIPVFGSAVSSDREFEKTASVMKLVVNGYAGAGTISMGGFDYHTGDRSTGEARDFRAGQCMGACLEYAARVGVPLMLYVFSDGSLSSNGMIDTSAGGRDKGVWTGDNQQTAAAFFLVYSPRAKPALMRATSNQIGYFRQDGDVETASSPAANSVNLLVQTVLLNYMALHSETGSFNSVFGNALGTTKETLDGLTALAPICNGTISTLV